MKDIANISSSPKNGKATLWFSVLLMSVIWLALAAILTLLVLETFALLAAWNIFLLIFVGVLSVLVVWLIPLQAVRYIHQLQVPPGVI